ncbi:tetratricopeptide repeat protein [candidate division KSB1 bacterium]|nr:tetratricopeptide repeat protein [candidate division KSB1 bacterium]
MSNIAWVLEAKGDYNGALEKYDEALMIFENLFGPNHPSTRTVRDNRDALLDSSRK